MWQPSSGPGRLACKVDERATGVYRTSTNLEFRKTTTLTSQCGMMHEPRRILHIKILRTLSQNELSNVRIMVAVQVAQTRNVAGQQTLQLHTSMYQINCFQTLYDLRALGFQRCARKHAPARMHWSMRGGATSWSTACGAETRGSLRDFGITRSKNVNRWFGLPVYAVCSGGNVLLNSFESARLCQCPWRGLCVDLCGDAAMRVGDCAGDDNEHYCNMVGNLCNSGGVTVAIRDSPPPARGPPPPPLPRTSTGDPHFASAAAPAAVSKIRAFIAFNIPKLSLRKRTRSPAFQMQAAPGDAETALRK